MASMSNNVENLSPQTIRGVVREMQELISNPPEGIKVQINEEDVTDIQAYIDGPAGTPYVGGLFRVKLALSKDFPQSPPKAFFLTKIFHPNVAFNGEICVNTLKIDWKPDLGIKHILLETQIVRLKHSLQNWREIVLPIHTVLLWEKNWHPGAIVGGSAFFFLSLWLLDPSVLTTISILGLTISLSDYLVPIIATTIFRLDSWTESKEKQYSDFCRAIVVYRAKAALNCAAFCIMRTTKPKLFYGVTIVTLLLLAWIGNIFNNLFLTFLLVSILLLTPGLEHHGILNKYGRTLTHKISECTILKTDKILKQQ